MTHRAPEDSPDEDALRAEREGMVEWQIRHRGVRDKRVLAAMVEVPRHLFVPSEERHQAYKDHPLAIGHGQTISQPYIVGLMLEAMRLTGPERVLEIGTGSGYQTALLARLAATVVSVERLEPLAEQSAERLREMGITNVEIHVGDGTLGWPPMAPYDAIVVTAASPKAPQPLLDQLVEGGRLVIPVGGRDEQMLVAIERRGEELRTTDLCPCRFVPLIGEHGFHV